MISLLMAALLAQLPEPMPAGGVVLRAEPEWVVLNRAAEVVARFDRIDTYAPETIAIVNGGVVFTAPRAPKQHGLFLKKQGQPTQDISISDGFHSWVTASKDGKRAVFSHQSSPGSGPPGAHTSMAFLQLWSIDLDTLLAKQLTYSPGCKTSPQFVEPKVVSFVHNTCNGFQGVSFIDLRSQTVTPFIPREGHRERMAMFSPSRKKFALVRPLAGGRFDVAVGSTRDPEDARSVFSTEGPAMPDLFWPDETRLVIQAGASTTVLKVNGGGK